MKNFSYATFENLWRLSTDAVAQSDMRLFVRASLPTMAETLPDLDSPFGTTGYERVYRGVKVIVDLNQTCFPDSMIHRLVGVGPSPDSSYLECFLNLEGIFEYQQSD